MLGSSEFPRYLDEIIESGMLQRFGDLIVAEAPQPSQNMWEKFYQILCDIKVKEWEKEYSDVGIIDGGGWEFKIRFKGIHRTTGGMNAYPKKIMVNGKKVDPFKVLYIYSIHTVYILYKYSITRFNYEILNPLSIVNAEVLS